MVLHVLQTTAFFSNTILKGLAQFELQIFVVVVLCFQLLKLFHRPTVFHRPYLLDIYKRILLSIELTQNSSITESVFAKMVPEKRIVRETSVRERDYPENV